MNYMKTFLQLSSSIEAQTTQGMWQRQYDEDKTTKKKHNIWTDCGYIPADAYLGTFEYGGWNKTLKEQNANARFVVHAHNTYPTLLKMLNIAIDGYKALAKPMNLAPSGDEKFAASKLQQLELLAKDALKIIKSRKLKL